MTLALVALASCAPEPVPTRTGRYTPRAQQSTSAQSVTNQMTLVTYVNGRYGFSCPMPQDWTQAERDDGSGATATSADGAATVSCLGGPLTGDATAPYLGAQAAAALEWDGYTIDASTSDETTYRVTAHTDDAVAIRWGAVGTEQFRAVEWDLPAAAQPDLQFAIDYSVADFQTGPIGEPQVAG